ncbi:SnoaL-like domain-containing protein [Flavivirga aquatica]|uniref:SnoaL-like domain-containing protein n=1 Tax=Flavivirga aquatica TaxID=1849968 RepID=UPI001F0A94F9|nr:SnoaL-like domain-containing protein [Flavivirga aquatica]
MLSGKQNVWNKRKQCLDNVPEFHSDEISSPIVTDNHFTSKMTFDVTFKDYADNKC